jgi:hypothetical protein
MATSETDFGFGGNDALRDRNEIKKHAEEMYKNSFGDLEDGTIYRDPLGFKTGGQPVELQKARWDQLSGQPVGNFANPGVAGESAAKPVIEKWNELQRKGYSLQDTFYEIRKSLDTGDWTLPLDIIPEVFTVQPERLPLVNSIPRVSTNDDEVVATPITDHPFFSWGLEGTAATNGSGDREYDYGQPTYGDLSYDVLGMGLATRLSDKMILASSNLRNAESTQEQAIMRGGQQTLERQLIKGTNFDAAGPQGLDDFISGGDGEIITTLDAANANPEDYEAATRTLINDAEYEGANLSQTAVVCDFDWHRKVRDSVTDVVRYEPMSDAFGVDTVFEYDGVPVFKSHAIDRISDTTTDTTDTKAYTINFDAHYLSVLQEMNMRPLARIGPQERFGVDMYCVLTAEDDGAHVRAAEVTGA